MGSEKGNGLGRVSPMPRLPQKLCSGVPRSTSQPILLADKLGVEVPWVHEWDASWMIECLNVWTLYVWKENIYIYIYIYKGMFESLNVWMFENSSSIECLNVWNVWMSERFECLNVWMFEGLRIVQSLNVCLFEMFDSVGVWMCVLILFSVFLLL